MLGGRCMHGVQLCPALTKLELGLDRKCMWWTHAWRQKDAWVGWVPRCRERSRGLLPTLWA